MVDKKELLLFKLGPVQEFIAQARSTRDLWSGSYMLSWLVAHAVKAVIDAGSLDDDAVQMPSLQGNPLITALRDETIPLDLNQVLIPNLPNWALICVPAGRGRDLGGVAKRAVDQALERMGNAVWQFLKANYQAQDAWKPRWDAQLRAWPRFTFAWTEWDGQEATWKAAYDTVVQNLAARRNIREFDQWNAMGEETVKDSLSGLEERIGDKAFWQRLHQNRLFRTASHCYGAMNLVKRLWIRVSGDVDGETCHFFADTLNFARREVRNELKVPDVSTIARQNIDPHVPYFAVLAFDGDKMGDTVTRYATNAVQLRRISQTLSTFALERVRRIVETFEGFLIYAGGDDVLALLPSSRAIDCARELRDMFKKIGAEAGYELNASCGIAVGHKKAPLQMLIKAAQEMEREAKGKYKRNAVAIALYKRSGEIIKWGTHWESAKGTSALDLMKLTTELTAKKSLSARFPYALAALLAPYGLGDKKQKAVDDATLRKIARAETEHVLSRQGAGLSGSDEQKFITQIDDYLKEVENLDEFVKLFLAETFLNRERKEM